MKKKDHKNEIPSLKLPDPTMTPVYKRLMKIARHNGPALLEGESGVGKTALSRSLHAESRRKDGPFLSIGCGELSEQAIESELFGHVVGAYTDAKTGRDGIFQLADGGTLTLNDVDLMSLATQAKLLRFLDDHSYSKLGDLGNALKADVRLVATTNKVLEEMVRKGTFLPDLYHRLVKWRVKIPPLRERPKDIEALANLFLEKFQHEDPDHQTSAKWYFQDEAIELLCSLSWNGNIRQLESAVQNIAMFAEGDRDHGFSLRQTADVIFDDNYPLQQRVEGVSGERLKTILEHTKWNISLTSKITGTARNTIYKRIKENHWRKPT